MTINGTDTNPWAKLGTRINPFPKLAKHEYQAMEMRLHELDGDPIRDEADIRQRLDGFKPEFVDGVIARWQPGKRVRFTITFPAGS